MYKISTSLLNDRMLEFGNFNTRYIHLRRFKFINNLIFEIRVNRNLFETVQKCEAKKCVFFNCTHCCLQLPKESD